MPILAGLPGTDGGPRDAEMFSSASAALKILRKGLAATTAGDNGAINVYRDDSNKYRCEMMRHMVSMDAQQFTTQAEVREWLRQWMLEIE